MGVCLGRSGDKYFVERVFWAEHFGFPEEDVGFGGQAYGGAGDGVGGYLA